MNIISRAANTSGAVASRRDQQKRTAYARVEPHGYDFVPLSAEICSCHDQTAMKLLHLLGDNAAGPVGVTRASFVNGALRELSVGLCRGNFLSYQASVGMFARSSGASLRAGLSVPTNECMKEYCVVFACDVLIACACRVHVEFLSAAVNALAGCCCMHSVFLYVWKYCLENLS
jgi:hypothetical protein